MMWYVHPVGIIATSDFGYAHLFFPDNLAKAGMTNCIQSSPVLIIGIEEEERPTSARDAAKASK